ncbi:MAG: WhiB family transcriptional regulator [Actinomycetota bacterium]|nr:WhiB family transcriptional regulator [Actinomycetota bacterium]
MRDEERHAWVFRAACRGMDPTMFFPGADEEGEEALAVCRACSVQEECLEYALQARERYGIWGGATERQRRRMLRRTA